MKTAAALLVLLATSAAAQDRCETRGASGEPGVGRHCLHGDGPPHSVTARSDAPGIGMALLYGATRDYAHGVLGDDIEARAMLVQPSGEEFCDHIPAGESSVFEDVGPRLADVTGNGRNEAVVVASHADLGARLEIWGYPSAGCGPEHDIRLLAATPHIGRRHRWLAPAAIADLDGDGHVEIAYVDRPHLAKILRIWRYSDGTFREVATLDGVTNHRIGDQVIQGGLRDCGTGPEIVLAKADWSGLVAIRFDGATATARDLDGIRNFQTALACD